jgi:uncharacterized protein (TIGR03086 family)
MSDLPDLAPATRLTASVVAAVDDDALDRPTPCPEYSVRHILAHLDGLSMAFTAAPARTSARWTPRRAPSSSRSPTAGANGSRQLETLADVWSDPAAWSGMTRAGGVDLPGEVAGLVALDEVVLHGWDLAKGTGHPYDSDPATAAVVKGFLAESRKGEVPESIFGPAVEIDDDAQTFDHALGLAGRNPAWEADALDGR